ncbi:3-(cis-5,6-dihydroxycyclohexa-1,3-dien-1-yl)propanoate dehydrogenase [Natrialba swarupiae]|uniref:3-(Cis-5,6-dihydroxycyclohexa-1, 3-dien-1-yl)propanoate dehydrogenase n=1 Tax=Natrialba swarupiae TaxID=2448032 RepID=A0A5D5ANY1_9EURY|nr:3-(cis-5,6-dihydroxycyclohexa-1,3-dien-1-yl)propanoate dehydrogenase [Natrialba swarupiae]TYT62595.1 3-(cis-5,6-dihydroxycyclohexa-1,3-dien-1-yl)propanoate dehydrogenase [Natrialba swarupiae]
MGWLDGKTALITGGGSGIGRAVVDRYVEEGATVGVLELDGDRVTALNEEYGDTVHAVQGDVSEWEDNERAVAETVSEFGKLDIFVGNAGIFDKVVQLADLEPDELETAFEEVFRVNVLGYMLGAKAALPELLKTEGCMVFTASYSSFYPATGGMVYTPSKHAIAGIIRELAYELAPKIRVNGVAPGYSPTNLSGVEALGQGESAADPDEIDERYPLRIPEAEEYAGYYVLLGSEENSRASTGAIIEADSGLSIRGADEPAGGTDL